VSKPDIVLRRAVESNGPFRERADLPTPSSLDAPKMGKPRSSNAKPKKAKARKLDEIRHRRAAEAFEKEQRRRKKQREKQQTAAEKLRSPRKAATAKAEAGLDEARRDNESDAAAVETDAAALQHHAENEEEGWQKFKKRLEKAIGEAADHA
jgi:hypothetical protein